MVLKSFRRIALVGCLALASLNGCILNNISEAGIPLPGSIDAAGLRAIVAETAFSSFIAGALAYCTDYQGLCSAASSEIAVGAILARTLTPDNLPIQDRSWFTADRVTACQDNVADGVQNQTLIYLISNEESGDTDVDTSGVSLQGFKNSLVGAAFFAAGSGEDCLDG